MSSEYEFDVDRVEGSGIVIKGTAGENLGNHKLIYMDPAGTWQLADADLAAELPVLGLTLSAANAGRKLKILLKGYVGDPAWAWVVGNEIYASSTPGELTQVAAGLVQVVGIAGPTTNFIYFSPKDTGPGGVVCALLEGSTAYVGFDVCKGDNYTNYWTVDGVADDVQIQQAIDYVGALGGGTVGLESGTYEITVTIDIDYDAVFLCGKGWSTILDVQAGLVYPAGIHVFGTVGVHIQGVFLRDFKIHMAYDNEDVGILIEYADETWCQNVEVENAHGYGIKADNDPEFCVFQNCYLHDNRRAGLFLRDGTYAIVSGCQIIYNERQGLYISNAAFHATIIGNNISYNGTGGIFIAIGDIKIIGNDISYNSDYGITHQSGAGAITGNVLARTGTVDAITIPGGRAIILNTCSDLTVCGNQINHCYYGTNNLGTGIYVVDSEDVVISGNQIWDLPVDAGAGVDGILLSNSDDVTIVGNEVDEVTGYGINISTATCDRTYVKSNKLVNCTLGCINDAGTDTAVHWIFVPVSDPNHVLGRHPVVDMPENTDTNVYAQIMLPLEFQELVTSHVIVVAAAAGNMVWTVNTDFGKLCATEDYNTHSDVGGDTTALLIDDFECIDISAALTLIAAGDLVGVDFMRDGDDVADDIEDSVYYLGIRVRYV